MIKGLVFDLDGTLLNTLEDIAFSVNEGLRQLGYPPFSVDRYRYFVGDGVRILVHRVLSEFSTQPSTQEQEALYQAYMENYAIHQFDTTLPYPGIEACIQTLQTSGLKIAVLSNKPHIDTVRVIEQYFPTLHQPYIFGKKPEFPPKPDPASLHALMKTLQLSNDEILYVGDTATDIQTAKNKGVCSVGVTWGFRQQMELETAGADYIIHHPDELIEILQNWK